MSKTFIIKTTVSLKLGITIKLMITEENDNGQVIKSMLN